MMAIQDFIQTVIYIIILLACCGSRMNLVSSYEKSDFLSTGPQTKSHLSNQKTHGHLSHDPLHRVALSKGTQPFSPENLKSKYNPIYRSRSYDMKHNKGMTEGDSYTWPHADDTDRLPRTITKSVNQEYTHWSRQVKCSLDYDCPPGRMCRNDQCTCMTKEMCAGHRSPVCGSDGHRYPSHCELHRTACAEMRQIRIDHKKYCFGKHMSNKHKPKEIVISVKQKIKQKDDHENTKNSSRLPKAMKTHIKMAANKHHRGNSKKSSVSKPRYTDDVHSKQVMKGKVKSDTNQKKIVKKTHFTPKMTPSKQNQKKGEETLVIYNSDDRATEVKKDEDLRVSHQTPCSQSHFEKFKKYLLILHCKKFGEVNCKSAIATDNAYLTKLMFRFYDSNMDGLLTKAEVIHADVKEPLQGKQPCQLVDIFKFGATSNSNNMNLKDFATIFDLDGSTSRVQQKVQELSAVVGHGLELTCDTRGKSGNIVWMRHGTNVKSLHMNDISSFNDGSMYISHVALHHSGNFTCYQRTDPLNSRTYHLKIQMLPVVRIIPESQTHKSHSDISVRCWTEGIPHPHISWQVNEVPIAHNDHYINYDHNETLVIKDAHSVKDTGAYKCVARNEAGITQHIATIFVENSTKTFQGNSANAGVFIVFHKAGYTIYDPRLCDVVHFVDYNFNNFLKKIKPSDSLSTLCRPNSCDWGRSVRVGSKFVYVSQPDLNRIIVVEIEDRWNPLEVIHTDIRPVELYYKKGLDQVWVLCWNGDHNSVSKTVVVIQGASKSGSHRIIHTQPVGDKFDLVKNVFLSYPNHLEHEFHHGYVVHSGQRGLYKLDLEELKYIKAVDLSQHDCTPIHVAFLSMGGKVIVQCNFVAASGNTHFLLEIDYLTDRVLSTIKVSGKPYITPDARHLVVVDFELGDVNVYQVTDRGDIVFKFLVETTSIISDVTFQRVSSRQDYDLYLNSHMRDRVFFIILSNGQFGSIGGEDIWESKAWTFNSPYHTINGGDHFGIYVAKSSDDGILIIDGATNQIACDFRQGEQSHEIIWIDP